MNSNIISISFYVIIEDLYTPSNHNNVMMYLKLSLTINSIILYMEFQQIIRDVLDGRLQGRSKP